MKIIIKSACISCGRCFDICHKGAVKKSEGIYEILKDICIDCGHCMVVCPKDAISSDEKVRYFDYGKVDEDVIEGFLNTRRSIRKYKDKPLPREVIERLLNTAVLAPSATNAQNWEFTVVTDKKILDTLKNMTAEFYGMLVKYSKDENFIKKLSQTMPDKAHYIRDEKLVEKVRVLSENLKSGNDRLFFDAPCFIALHADKSSVHPLENCCYALYNMVLLAHSMGIGSCINGLVLNPLNFNKKMRDVLSVPDNNLVYATATFGYKIEEFTKIPDRKKAKVTWL